MISVDEAERLIRQSLPSLKEIVSRQILDIQSDVLAEDIVADRDLPPYHRVAMDGIAISFAAWASGVREFKITGIQRAGAPAIQCADPMKECIEVMTGAMLPKGCDTVVRVEDLIIDGSQCFIKPEVSVTRWSHVHKQGEDCRKGEVLLEKGRVITAQSISVLASVGKSFVNVYKPAQITLVSTGDELVDLDETPAPHQIRRSNIYAMASLLQNFGFKQVTLKHFPDHREQIFAGLKEALQNSDVVILSGGVSMGRFDFVPGCLADLGVKQVFHKIKQKPGKPMWFGVSDSQKPVFALPGNPVSTLVCLRRYVLPALQWLRGDEAAFGKAFELVLEEEIIFKKSMTYFVPAKLTIHQGTLMAKPVVMHGSGDFCSLIKSDGFLALPENKECFPKGSVYPFYFWQESDIYATTS